VAGDWLKVEGVTPDKPEVFEIATLLKIPPTDAFGRLFLVWRWFDAHTENGNAANVSAAYIDHIAGVAGFAQAMQSVRWLDASADGAMGCTLPHFDRHNGKTAKSRALTSKRVAKHKERNANGALTLAPLPREEKRRSNTFAQFWAAYPRKRSKGDAERAWKALSPSEQLTDIILQAVERAKTTDQWRRESGQFIPYPATWLRAKGWEDEMAPAARKVVAL
jgi:hypothetical protein